jgi:hypothetical protein
MYKHISKHPETKHLSDDVVHYREYKILLQPDRFTSKRGFLDFWKDVENPSRSSISKSISTGRDFTARFVKCSFTNA